MQRWGGYRGFRGFRGGAIHGGGSSFTPQPVASALGQWVFLQRHGARAEATSTMNFDGVRFEVQALRGNGVGRCVASLAKGGWSKGKVAD